MFSETNSLIMQLGVEAKPSCRKSLKTLLWIGSNLWISKSLESPDGGWGDRGSMSKGPVVGGDVVTLQGERKSQCGWNRKGECGRISRGLCWDSRRQEEFESQKKTFPSLRREVVKIIS